MVVARDKVVYSGGVARIVSGPNKGKYLQPDGRITSTPTGRTKGGMKKK